MSKIVPLSLSLCHILFTPRNFQSGPLKTAQSTATRIYKVCMGFHMKIPLYQRFHTFLARFHTFDIEIFDLEHKDRPINCYTGYLVHVGLKFWMNFLDFKIFLSYLVSLFS